jgi:hypothetical protein
VLRAREMNQSVWTLEGFANFSSGMHEAKFTLHKQSDGSYKINDFEFD